MQCDGRYLNALLYGVVNAILTIPDMYTYAAIIFSHEDFRHNMPVLMNLVMFSSAVHQAMFILLSSLPFAIGQVQDAGLIFLSAMATSICDELGSDVSIDAKIATVIVTTSLATASLGLCLVLIGHFRLASLASYIPIPVLSAYLAYIGVFFLYAGLSMSTGLTINSLVSLAKLWDAQAALLIAPSILCGLLLLVVQQRCSSALVLPLCIIAMPICFYIITLGTNTPLQDARRAGWVKEYQPPGRFIDMWRLFDFELVHWSVIPSQLPTWLAMVLIVAFSSSLDVAAIEMEMGQRLDMNKELRCVGWSNFVSGCAGGYTGSYIFSLTILTYRSKSNSRIVGVCVSAAEFALVWLPVSTMSFLPRFSFAAPCVYFGLDMIIEYLVKTYSKVPRRDYLVFVASFIAINWLGLEMGLLVGLGAAALNLIVGLSRVPVATRVVRRSTAPRTNVSNEVLQRRADAIVVLELHGELPFSSAVRVTSDIHGAIVTEELTDCEQKSFSIQPSHTLRADYSVMVDVAAPTRQLTEYLILDFSGVSGMDATAVHSLLLCVRQLKQQHGIHVVFAGTKQPIRSLLLANGVADSQAFAPSMDAALGLCEDFVLVGGDASLSCCSSSYHEELTVVA